MARGTPSKQSACKCMLLLVAGPVAACTAADEGSPHLAAVWHMVCPVEVDQPRDVGCVTQRLDVIHHLLPSLLQTQGQRWLWLGVANHQASCACISYLAACTTVPDLRTKPHDASTKQ